MTKPTVQLFGRVRRSVAFRMRRTVVRSLTGPYTSVLRRRSKRARRSGGVTIIAVNFNTLPYLQAMVRGIRRHSPANTPIMVIDNASTDGSRDWIKSQPGVQIVRLPANVNHGPAMDIGILRCRTEYFVALDVDAFPISDEWIDLVVNPLRDGSHVAGAYVPFPEGEPYVHACYLAMSSARFADESHTFDVGPSWDTAQRISQREAPNLHLVPLSSCRGPALVGSVFGAVVYHNFYSARFAASGRDVIDEGDSRETMIVRPGDASSAWSEAMERYFPESDFSS